MGNFGQANASWNSEYIVLFSPQSSPRTLSYTRGAQTENFEQVNDSCNSEYRRF